MVKSKRIGNDFNLHIYVYRLNSEVIIQDSESDVPAGAVPENMETAKNIVLTLINTKDRSSVVLTPSAKYNLLSSEIKSKIQKVGKCYVLLEYDRDDIEQSNKLKHSTADFKAFEIVSKNAEATVEGDVTLYGLIRAGLDGMSAFEIWKTEMNNNNLTVTDFLAYLQKPAIDAVEAGELTLSQYVSAAQAAQAGAEQAKQVAASKAIDAFNSAADADASEYNALKHRNAALVSEQNASSSEQNAKASELAAESSENKAKISEDNSKNSETNAGLSKDAAKLSETAAKTSETNAKASETNSKTSENNAKSSETAAAASAKQAADTLAGKANQVDLVQLGANLSDNVEPALAELLNHLLGRISALESIIKNSIYKNMQVDSVDIVKTFNIYGATNIILTGTAAPAVVPDFIGQFFVNTTGGVSYQAKGIASTSDWKQISN